MGSLAEIVLKSFVKRLLFLRLPSLEDFFPPPVVDIGRRHVADSLVIPPVVVELDEPRQGSTQFLRAGIHQQIQSHL